MKNAHTMSGEPGMATAPFRRHMSRIRTRRTRKRQRCPPSRLLLFSLVLLWAVLTECSGNSLHPQEVFVAISHPHPEHNNNNNTNNSKKKKSKTTSSRPSSRPTPLVVPNAALASVGAAVSSPSFQDALHSGIRESTGTSRSATTTSNSSNTGKNKVQVWADRYTNPSGLREAFGSNKNSFWGDLDAATARKLYKTLLPKALMELAATGVATPEDLAPLAYQARVAAKLYARERCKVPSRLMAAMYDGVRTLKRYGRFQPVGMSYEQVWDKYQQIVLETDDSDDDTTVSSTDSTASTASTATQINSPHTTTTDATPIHSIQPQSSSLQPHHSLTTSIDSPEASASKTHSGLNTRTDKGFARSVSWKILESSCRSNENIDRWVLSSPTDTSLSPISATPPKTDLSKVARTLEDDVQRLLTKSRIEPSTLKRKDLASQ